MTYANFLLYLFNMESKICKTCDIPKAIDEFYHHRASCKECVNKQKAKWRNNNSDRMKFLQNRWEDNNKDKRRKRKAEYIKERRKTNNLFALRSGLSRLIRMSMIREGYKKDSKTEEILGCSFEEFKTHIESQFEPWMRWDNKGLYNSTPNYGWDIDHIIPVASGLNEEEVIRLNHYTNLQPLCSYVNRVIKKDNIIHYI